MSEKKELEIEIHRLKAQLAVLLEKKKTAEGFSKMRDSFTKRR